MIDRSILTENLNSEVELAEFFHAFGYRPEDTIYFRMFKDPESEKYMRDPITGEIETDPRTGKKKKVPGEKRKSKLGWLNSIVPTLKQYNQRNYGVFWTVHGGGDSDPEVIASGSPARAQFAEIDPSKADLKRVEAGEITMEDLLGDQIDTLSDFPLEPSVIVRTWKSLHCYWLLNGGDIKRFRGIQKRLIARFHSDSSIQNESRVMRVPGFEHRKHEPVQIRILKFDPDMRYTQDQIEDTLDALGVARIPKKSEITPQADRSSGKKIPHGERYKYVESRIGELVGRLKTSVSDEVVLAMVEADFRENCEDPDDTDTDFRDTYLPVIRKFQQRAKAEQEDPEFWKYNRKAWINENPGKSFDPEQYPEQWNEAREAGDKAREAGLWFGEVLPGNEAQQPTGGNQSGSGGASGAETRSPTITMESLQETLETITKESLLSGDLVEAVFRVADAVERQKMLNLCREKAGVLRCKSDFKKLEAVVRKKAKQEQADRAKQQEIIEQSRRNTLTVTVGGSSRIFQTGAWFVNQADGITRFSGEKTIRAGRYPVYIHRRFRNRETGQEKMELCWSQNKQLRSITANRGTVLNSRKIIELADIGFPVTTGTASNMVSYLDDFEFLNLGTIPQEVSSGKFGWLNDKQFIPYTEEAFFDGASECKSLVDSIAERGDPEKWLEVVRKVRASGRKEPQVYMSGAFGSVLVSLLDLSPFIVNLYGVTGIGKTVCLMLCASIWGNPQGRGFIAESNSTLNSLELKLNVLNNLPLLVDDLSKIRGGDIEKLTDMIYTLCSGGGKGRATRSAQLRSASTWSNIILTNMERPLVNDGMRGGAVNRVLDFQIEDGKIFRDAGAVVDAVSNSYGHAGKMFVDAVKEIGRDGLREMMAGYRKRIEAQSGEAKEEKQIIPLALLMVADEIAERSIFRDGVRLDMDYCISALKSINQVNELERAYQYLMDETVANDVHFLSLENDVCREPWGSQMEEDQAVAYLPTKLEAMLSGHADLKQFVRWADKLGLIIRGDGRHIPKRIPKLGNRRCYVIRTGHEPDEQESFRSLSLEEPVPF